ncbi:MAG: hypothetical protein F4Y54_00590 [Dehalococcoidia bacterium]|nr:hypothetical protein [Dehalococcoidia bacterium]
MKKTTINIDDALMARLKEEAARRKTTMGALVDAGIRRILAEGEAPPPVGELPPLPIYDMGEPLVDVADRDALYEVLDRERDERLYGARQNITGSNVLRSPAARAAAEDVAPYDADGEARERTGHA